MKITRKDLDWATGKGLLQDGQAEALWTALSERMADSPRFDLVHLIYYFGGLLVMGAMGWFMGNAWENLGGAGIFGLSAGYGLAYLLLGRWFWTRRGLRVPGGLLVTAAVAMVPLAVYGLQRWSGIWAFDDPGEYRDFHRWIRGGWFLMEVATVLAGLLAIRFCRFPFLTAPVAAALWYMSMDLTPILFGAEPWNWDMRKLVSLWFGLAMLVVSYLVDRRTKADFAFWGYLFGLMAFWGGLTLLDSDSELNKFLYFLVNILLLGLSVFLRRRAFAVFGAFGVMAYLGHLAFDLFEDSLMFPVVLSAIGLLMILAGIQIRRQGKAIEEALIGSLPEPVRSLRPVERGIVERS